MKMLKDFLANKRPGWYVSVASLLLGLITVIVYTARGGNYLSPVSSAAVVLLVFAVLTNAAVLVMDFKVAAFIPMILYACTVAVFLNTEMLFITNVIFGVDGNYFDGAFFTFLVTGVLAMVTSAVAFAMGLSKSNKLKA
jgi:hypothetical protein